LIANYSREDFFRLLGRRWRWAWKRNSLIYFEHCKLDVVYE